jgi:hypothetical protein
MASSSKIQLYSMATPNGMKVCFLSVLGQHAICRVPLWSELDLCYTSDDQLHSCHDQTISSGLMGTLQPLINCCKCTPCASSQSEDGQEMSDGNCIVTFVDVVA